MSFIQQIGLEAGNKNALGKLHPGPDRQLTGALFTVSSLVSVAGPAAVSNSGAASPSLQATCCSRWAPIWKGTPGHSRVLCAEGVRAPPDRSTLTQGQGWQRAGPGPGALCPPRSVRQAAPGIPGPPGRAAAPLPAPSAPPPATGQTPWRSPTRLSQAGVPPPPSETVSKPTAHLPGHPELTATGPAGLRGSAPCAHSRRLMKL